MNPRILIVEDEPEVRDYLGLALKQQGFSTDFAEDGEEALNALQRPGSEFGAMLLDIIMPRKDGLDTLREVRQMRPGLPVVMLSGSCSTAHIIQAMKSGASDFLQKPISLDDLGNTLSKILKTSTIGPAREARVATSRTDELMVPNWASKIERHLSSVGESEVPVLLRGETGTGKEVLARQLHARSPRRDKPFLKVNCAALPSELVESELFGYERGAFTGAFKTSEGRFKQADGGTIFLDEIGDMDVKLQAKLLQVLQDQEFLRLGSKDSVRVNVRVMAATHCDLEEAIRQGKFRADLYYRLNVISLRIPPLRERREEVLGLFDYLARKHSNERIRMPEASPSLRQALLEYDWPGNIRELENIVRQFLVLQDSEVVEQEVRRRQMHHATTKPKAQTAAAGIGFGHVGVPATDSIGASAGSYVPPFEPQAISQAAPHSLDRVDEFKKNAEANVILSALKTTRWNRRQAAEILKIDYKALLYKMKKLNIGSSAHAG